MYSSCEFEIWYMLNFKKTMKSEKVRISRIACESRESPALFVLFNYNFAVLSLFRDKLLNFNNDSIYFNSKQSDSHFQCLRRVKFHLNCFSLELKGWKVFNIESKFSVYSHYFNFKLRIQIIIEKLQLTKCTAYPAFQQNLPRNIRGSGCQVIYRCSKSEKGVQRWGENMNIVS